jgi:hypothetical protein
MLNKSEAHNLKKVLDHSRKIGNANVGKHHHKGGVKIE